ncbi:ribosomal protein S1 [Helcococcus kunzii ATCC 51366]|uniref:Ribosomal protein S1 n=1 Tax=Helcococcus kunzii ATCC 51366 TaxID=883114 RepID=H3NN61_9FIRM|nr:ribosomal protein S1 [Helcococcus kunzii ATCC 51366]
MDNISNEEFMEQVEESMVKIYPKDIVKGIVINVKEDEVFVDIKYRADGIIKTDEMSEEEAADPLKAFTIGDEIDVYVIKLDDGEGNVSLSTSRVEGLKNWKKLMDAYENGEVVKSSVKGSNSGGLVVKVMGINGFIPASQITTYFVKNFDQYIGKELDTKVINIDEKKKRVVLSSRALQEEKLDTVWETLIPDAIVTGKVVRMVDFGAFVDLGGVDGLIHISDISWDRIEKPSDALEVGQEVEVKILKANREKNRVSLGLKQLTEKPFDVFLNNHKVGDVVEGEVVNLLDFGAFLKLKEGVEGLVHVSQISTEHVEKPSDVLNVGDKMEVKILEIDEENQRISLSKRALMEPKQTEKENKVNSEKKQAPRKNNNVKNTPKVEEENTFGSNIGDLLDELNLED